MLSIFYISAQSCPLEILAEDLSKNPRLVEVLDKSENFESWHLLQKAKSPRRQSIDEIYLVADNIDEIKKIGGYNKWLKNLEKFIPDEAFFKNVNSLAETFDKNKRLSKHHKGLIYTYYNQKKWKKIEELFKEFNLNGNWPPANGGYNIIDDVAIKKGEKFDRYQTWFNVEDNQPIFGGAFTSPIINDKTYNYSQRALKGKEIDYAIRYEIEVLKDLPVTGQKADIIPWFGQKGRGKQMLFNFDKNPKYKSFKDLMNDGFIKITIKESPNKEHLDWIGKSYGKVINKGGKAFKEILIDIPKAINKRLSHITSAEMVTKNGTTFRLTGVHSDLAKADIYIVKKQGKKVVSRTKTNDYVVDIQKVEDGLNGVYIGKVVIKDLQGNVIVSKSGNGGISTFFPNNRNKTKIADEVEFAIKNNKGYIDPTDINKGYYGFSSDGKIKIGFYYNETTGTINSYFPLIN
ncbi:EndoU domain-containing protein [Tenacibaculum maritimum]|uniref:EndoU domain-containing protein n=1 Tax=Tenacibaculum maritimum TaxID=107401 RepID=UPI0012E5EA03|nr:EndoU domain-containing protein [Tenacibaculum maritimum]CAA0166632.1 hypothetical protein TMP445_160006 [Tenacibaculum maritimum]